jgi:MSHA biogenesis protein MshM
MYLQHFGLEESPFSLTPDPGFFFNYAGHQQAFNVLLVALQSGEGFIKISGEVGTGKTLLCRKLLAALDDEYQTAYLPNPLLSPFELHQALAEELGIDVPEGMTMHDLVKRITARLVDLHKADKKAVLCIDEAQAMARDSLEALRLLSNLETEKAKLLQIVVFAQPEIDALLERPDLRQLRQRITFSYSLPPLDSAGVAGYVAHRLLIAGYQGGNLFRPAALEAVHRASRGIPRLVNILSHKALMAAYGQGHKAIDLAQIESAISDTEDATPLSGSDKSQLFYWGLGAVTLVEIALIIYLLRSVL